MNGGNLSRERLAWTAAVIALATSASWLAAISLVLLVRQAGAEAPEVVVAARALFRVAWVLVRQAAPAAVLVAIGSGLLVLIARALWSGAPARGRARHA